MTRQRKKLELESSASEKDNKSTRQMSFKNSDPWTVDDKIVNGNNNN
jgi:hypothetical protein